jgi:hypothetical protein
MDEATLTFLPNKAIPTWMVKHGNTKVFFNKNNGGVFTDPYKRALAYFNKLTKKK